MKVLIVSDTHGQDENLEETVLREAPFDYLIHCGDVEGREIFIEALAECPCTIVAGNNDFFTDLPYEEEVTLEGHKILVTHGHHYFVSRDYDKLVENVNYFRDKMTAAGFDIKPTQSAICAVMLYDAKLSQIYAARMQEEGIYVTGFYYPVVPKDQARIRVQISAGHEKAHLDKCIAAFIKVGKELNLSLIHISEPTRP